MLLKPSRLPRGINNVILGAVYHPNNDDNTLCAHIFEALDKALTNYPNSAIILAGDFNKFTPGNLCLSFKLKQLVDKPPVEAIFWTKFTPLSQIFMIKFIFVLP